MTEVGGLCSRDRAGTIRHRLSPAAALNDALLPARLQIINQACQSGRGIADDACERKSNFSAQLIFVNLSLRWTLDNKGSAL
jgi:hypothetical protein